MPPSLSANQICLLALVLLANAAHLASPPSVWVTSQSDLFIVDQTDQRILLFYGAGDSPTQSGKSANVAFGRPNVIDLDFLSGGGAYHDLVSLFFDDELGIFGLSMAVPISSCVGPELL